MINTSTLNINDLQIRFKDVRSPELKRSHPRPIFTIKVNDDAYQCQLDSKGKSIVHDHNESFRSLERLTRKHPDLMREENLYRLALISNFLFAGLEYTVIENIDEYKDRYLQDSEDTKEAAAFLPNSLLKSAALFDIDQIHPPRLAENQLIFFVKDSRNIPYRVTCEYPFREEGSNVKYSLLPYIDF